MKSGFLILLGLYLSIGHASAQMTCAVPSQQIIANSDLADAVASNDSSKVKKVVVDVISRYPNADRVLLQRDLISSVCELIKNSGNASFSDKSKLLIDLTREIQSTFSRQTSFITPIDDAFLLFSSYNPGELEASVIFVLETTVWKQCNVNGNSVEYGNAYETRRFMTFGGLAALQQLPRTISLSDDQPGNFIISIPKFLLFQPADSGRSGIAYFNSLPSTVCYSGDVEAHIGLKKTDGAFIAAYVISSITDHGQCIVRVRNEAPNAFQKMAQRYRNFLKKLQGSSERHYAFAGKSDAFDLINQVISGDQDRSNDPNTLSVTFESDALPPKCMNVSLVEALKT